MLLNPEIWKIMTEYRKIKIMIGAGGTGGHIFPALSIADKLIQLNPENELLFLGAKGRMEMEKVPAAGYHIVGLPIAGLQRSLSPANILNNLKLPFKVMESVKRAATLIEEFEPNVVVGVGGYASAPLLWAANRLKVPILIQEQNSIAGLTNKLLSKKAESICVAYEGMDKFFPSKKIRLTGNPIRSGIHCYTPQERSEALKFYDFNEELRHICIIGGSLGCATLNQTMKNWIEAGCPGGEGVEILWQCGSYYKKDVDAFMQGRNLPGIRYTDFITRMDFAYALSDVVVSRAGALAISEICEAGKAAVFVPSPNVSEDHQTRNAEALVKKGAALMVRDNEAVEKLMPTALELASDSSEIEKLSKNIYGMAYPNASQSIAEEIYRIAR